MKGNKQLTVAALVLLVGLVCGCCVKSALSIKASRIDMLYLEAYLSSNGFDEQEKNYQLFDKVYDSLLSKLERVPFEQKESIKMDESELKKALNKPIEDYPAIRSMLVRLRLLKWIAREHVNECQPETENIHRQLLEDLAWSKEFKLLPLQLVASKENRLRNYVHYFITNYYVRCPAGLSEMLADRLLAETNKLEEVEELFNHVEARKAATGMLEVDGEGISQELLISALAAHLEGYALEEGGLEKLEEVVSKPEILVKLYANHVVKVCKDLDESIGPLIMIYDLNEYIAGKAYPSKPLKRWQTRQHLCKKLLRVSEASDRRQLGAYLEAIAQEFAS